MRAMVLERPGTLLQLRDLPMPALADDEILIRVEACGVCRTDLHILDGDLRGPVLPLVPGHEIVGRVERFHQRRHELGIYHDDTEVSP